VLLPRSEGQHHRIAGLSLLAAACDTTVVSGQARRYRAAADTVDVFTQQSAWQQTPCQRLDRYADRLHQLRLIDQLGSAPDFFATQVAI
jgi:hypothetical protein